VTADPRVVGAVADAHRRDWGYVLAATVRVARDLDLAEECVQDAYARALTSWSPDELPERPAQWLSVVARRRAVDVIRREQALRRRLPLLVEPDGSDPPDVDRHRQDDIPDDRLRLVFVCCHPALAVEAQAALTLRLLCGLSTAEVARAFLVKETAMAARITRAKAKIASAGIPFRIPPRDALTERIDAVLTVVHLLFTTGHTAPAGPDLTRDDLARRAVDLGRMLHALLPNHSETAALLALMLLTDARRAARTRAEGSLVLLEDQDRSAWDRDAIAEGASLVRGALAHRPPRRFALMAAIAAVHAEAASWDDTDWPQIVALYDLLARVWPSPVVSLNRAVAVGFARGFAEGLDGLDALCSDPRLALYGYLAASRADFLRRLGRHDEARVAYEEALVLTDNEAERRFLRDRLRTTPAVTDGQES